MRSVFPLMLAAVVLPVTANAGDLLQLYDMAQRNDATFAASQHARDAALEAEPAARALLLPQLSASYDLTFNDSDTQVSYTDPTFNTPVNLSRSNNGTDRNLNVNLTQPLFNLESWRRLQQAGEQTALAQLTFIASEQSLLLRVAQAYFGLLAAHDGLRSANAEKDALHRQLDLAQQNLELGLSSVTDEQDVQVRYDLSQATELDADQALTDATAALEEITKEPISHIDPDHVRVVPLESAPTPAPRQLAALRDDAVLPPPQSATADQWIAMATSTNLNVTSALLKFNIAVRGVDMAQARNLPTVGAKLAYSDFKTASGTFPTESNGGAVTIGVTLPIYSGGATRSAIRSAEAIRDQRMAEYDGAQRLVERDTRSAYKNVLTSAARTRAYKQALASSQSALDASQTGLEIGTRSTIDLLNAQQQRFHAERDFQRARYDYLLAILRLKQTAGLLSLRDLTDIDALLVRQ
jgi:outer membrane protein